jgi:hypothetical protein
MRPVEAKRAYAGGRWPGIPRPFAMVIFEWQTVGFEVGIYTPQIEGSLVYVGIDFDLSPVAADALVVVWPGLVEPGGRRAAVRRLLGRE